MNIRQFYRQQKNLLAGIFLIALLSFALWYSYQNKKQVQPSNRLVVHATYNKADGVSIGSQVRLAGIEVGRVSAIQLDAFYRVQVTLTLVSNLQLPVDSAALIETDGIVGGKYIELLPGGELDTMQNGDYFMYTQDVLLLDELLARFIAIMRAKKGVVDADLVEGGKE
jgi:phospholipid/cholesterol/gamma-HCH transport system substrate-binding protein